MKRSVKNAISVVLILLLCGSIFGTMLYAKNHIGHGGNHPISQNSNKGGNPPSMPDGSSTESSSNNSSTGNQSRQMPNKSKGKVPSNFRNKRGRKLPITYYIIFGVEGFLIFLILIFLILSRFHKKTGKEVWGDIKKSIRKK